MGEGVGESVLTAAVVGTKVPIFATVVGGDVGEAVTGAGTEVGYVVGSSVYMLMDDSINSDSMMGGDSISISTTSIVSTS